MVSVQECMSGATRGEGGVRSCAHVSPSVLRDLNVVPHCLQLRCMKHRGLVGGEALVACGMEHIMFADEDSSGRNDGRASAISYGVSPQPTLDAFEG